MENIERLAGRLAQGMNNLDENNPEEISVAASLVTELTEALASTAPRVWSDSTRNPKEAIEAKTALVVDSVAEDRAALRQMLEAAGYSVSEAENGVAALAFFDSGRAPLHIMFTDVLLHDMSGRELAERAAGLMPGMGIVYMSGYADDEVLRCGVLSAGSLILRKPATPEALKQKLNAAAATQYA